MHLGRGWVVLCALGVGCVDPGASFDDFVTRQREGLAMLPDGGGAIDAGDPATFRLPDPDELNGEFLLVTSTVLNRKKPTVYRLQVEAMADGDGLALRMRDRPLAAADRMTPVGEFGPYRDGRVTSDGRFEMLAVNAFIPAAANAIAEGVEGEALLDYRGRVSSARTEDNPDATLDFYCGTVDGELLRPLTRPLDGSTFTVLRIPDSGEWPTIVINCNKDEADPL